METKSTQRGSSKKASQTSIVRETLDTLKALDAGADVPALCLTASEVRRFCVAMGFTQSWAGKTIDEIAPKDRAFGPHVVPERDAKIVLEVLKAEFARGTFKSPDPASSYGPNLLNDFLPKATGRFAGKPCLGHLWEFRYALAVELEHGRTRGTNVTNNHPLLTSLVVLAHLTEDTTYYPRLWELETRAELANALDEGKPAKEIKDVYEEHLRAQLYLGARLREKYKDIKLPS